VVCAGGGGAPAKLGVGGWVGEVQGGEVELALESNRAGKRWRAAPRVRAVGGKGVHRWRCSSGEKARMRGGLAARVQGGAS